MQTNFNSTQNFGMAMKISTGARQAITRRVKNEHEVKQLAELIKSQEKNPFSVDLRAKEDDSFEVFIKDETVEHPKLITFEESWFSRKFKSPIAFIKKACGAADQLNEKNYNPSLKNQIDNVLNEVPEY